MSGYKPYFFGVYNVNICSKRDFTNFNKPISKF